MQVLVEISTTCAGKYLSLRDVRQLPSLLLGCCLSAMTQAKAIKLVEDMGDTEASRQELLQTFSGKRVGWFAETEAGTTLRMSDRGYSREQVEEFIRSALQTTTRELMKVVSVDHG